MPKTPISTERLWELLSHKLRSFLERRVSDRQVAEDLLQETFVRIHKGLDELDDEVRIEPWVFQITRNLVIDHQRSRKAGPADPDDADATLADDPVDGGNLNDVVRDWIPAMIDQLPEPYSLAVRLYELEGVSQQEIADRTGVSLSGAKSRIQRGREKLKALLFDCCSFERDSRGNVLRYTRNAPGSCAPCSEE